MKLSQIAHKKLLGGGIFADLSIRNKILLSYLIVMIVALTALGTYSSLQSSNRIKTNIDKNVEIVLQNKCGVIVDEMEKCNITLMNVLRNRSIYNVVRDGYDYSSGNGLWGGMSEIIEPTLESAINTSKYVDKITVYADYTGPEVGTLLLKKERIENDDWYKTICKKYGIKWFYANGEVFAACEYRNIWENGAENNSESVSVVRLGVNKKIFNTGAKERENNYLFRIVNENQTEVYSDMLNKACVQKDDKIVMFDGERYLRSGMEIEGTDWTLEAFVPYSSVYSGIGEIWLMTALLMLMCIVIIAVLGIWFSNTVMKSICDLSHSMEEIGKGNFDTEIIVNSNDEIGVIAKNMRGMQHRLKNMVDRLYKTEIEKKKYELDILRAQINPHFLYNVLSAIKWTAIDEDANKTAKLVTMLSTFYRTGLNDGEETICFADELKNATAYIEMERIAHGDKFDVEYAIDEEINNYNCITFILQPIIENAIFHGLKPKREERGKISVTARVSECIELTISDNGVGMSARKCQSLLSCEGSGYGISNIQKRICLMCGEKYGLTIKSGKCGTDVTIRLPKDIPAPKKGRTDVECDKSI